jgi:hypothetical protein
MLRGRSVIAATTLVVAMATPGYAQTVVPGPSAIQATGTLTVEASTTGRVSIEVPDDATLNIHEVELTGAGRLFGYLLIEPRTMERFVASAIQYPSTFGWPRRSTRDGRKAIGDREDGFDIGCDECHVPPGLYDLYVIADGAPVAVSLTFEGLEGNTSLTGTDLTSTPSAQIDTDATSSTVAGLGQETFEQTICCTRVGRGVALLQMATSYSTATTANATRDICMQREGTSRCSSHGWSEPSAVLQNASVVTYPVWEIDGSTYSISSILDADAGLTELSIESDLDGVVIGY